MPILIRYLSLVLKLISACLIWAAVFTSMARAESSNTLSQVRDSLWTMGVYQDQAFESAPEGEEIALEEPKEIPEELQKALEVF